MRHALVTAHFLMSAFTVAKRAWESLSEELMLPVASCRSDMRGLGDPALTE
jgi:hypothetical protein